MTIIPRAFPFPLPQLPKRLILATAAAGLALLGTGTPALAEGDAAAGKAAYRACAACHAVDPGVNRVGPSLHGIYGRKAGAVEGFRYSPALANSGLVWNTETLDSFLENPRAFLRGNRMAYPGLRSEQARKDVIAYLKTLK